MNFSKCFVLVLGIFVLVSMIQVEAADSLVSSPKALSFQGFLQAFFNAIRNVLKIIFGKKNYLKKSLSTFPFKINPSLMPAKESKKGKKIEFFS